MRLIWTVTRDASLMLAAQGFARAVGIVTTLYIARTLGPAGYGGVRTAFAYLTVLLFLTDLGLDRVVLRQAARTPDDLGPSLSPYFTLRFWLAVAATLAAVATVPVLPLSAGVRTLVACGAGTILFTGLTGFFFQADFARRKFLRVSALQMLDRLLAGGATIGLLALWRDERAVMAATAAAAAVSCLLIGPIVLRGTTIAPRLRCPWSDVGRIVRPGIWFSAAGVMGLVFARVDVLMVSILRGELETAKYGVALAVVAALTGALGAFFMSLFPVTARNPTRDYFGRLFLRTAQGAVVAAAISGLIAWGAAWIVRALFGDAFAGAAAVLRILVWIFPLAAAYLGCQLLFETTDHQKSNVLAHFILMVVSVTAGLLWIPTSGAVGAAQGLLAGGVATLLYAVPRSFVLFRSLPRALAS